MPKISKAQADSYKEIAAASVNAFIEIGATKDEEPKLKKQIRSLFDSGMTKTDFDQATRTLARDKEEKYLKSLKYVRKMFGI